MLVFDTHDGPVRALAFSPDDGRLATAGRHTVAVWTAAGGQVRAFGHPCFREVLFTPDGSAVLADGGIFNQVRTYHPDGDEERTHAQPDGLIRAMAFDPAGGLAVYSWVGGAAHVVQWWSFERAEWTDRWHGHKLDMPVMRFDPGGRQVATAGDGRVDVWRLPDREKVGYRVLPDGPTPLLAYSPDGRRLVYGAGRRLVVAETGELLRQAELRGGRSHFTAVLFDPSGRWLAVTSNDAAVRLYDTSRWELAHTFTFDVGKLRCVAFSPDGLRAAAGGDTGRVVVWDV